MEQSDDKSKTIKFVKNKRRKGNINQYLVVFEGEKGDILHWVDASKLKDSESNVKTLNEYDKEHKTKKKKQSSRKIVKIIGITYDNDENKKFVVLYQGSKKPEPISYKRIRKNYPRLLLQFYEDNLVFEKSND